MKLLLITKKRKEVAGADAYVRAGDRLARLHDYGSAAQAYQLALNALTPYKGKFGVDSRIEDIQDRLTIAISRKPTALPITLPPATVESSGYEPPRRIPTPPAGHNPNPSSSRPAPSPPRRAPVPPAPPYRSSRVLILDPKMERVRGYIEAAEKVGADVTAAMLHLQAAERKGSGDLHYENNLRKAQMLVGVALDRLKISKDKGFGSPRLTRLDRGDGEDSPKGEDEKLEAFECPSCGADVGAADARCGCCGAEFESDEPAKTPGLGDYAAGAHVSTTYEPPSDKPVPGYVPPVRNDKPEAGQGTGVPSGRAMDPETDRVLEEIKSGVPVEPSQDDENKKRVLADLGFGERSPDSETARVAEKVKSSPPVEPSDSDDVELSKIRRRMMEELQKGNGGTPEQ
ncbi:MAG: hypothetical protein HY362_03845 [Candidatus Aenigmarchaeota archaeon]|nr:hypothetical protein [Candidatus Aenigmarchaeota archaeon]